MTSPVVHCKGSFGIELFDTEGTEVDSLPMLCFNVVC